MSKSSRRGFLKTAATGAASADLLSAQQTAPVAETAPRPYWIGMLTRLADPVLHALAEQKLKASMPVEAPRGNSADRRQYTYLEAIGRLLAGMAPWLESGDSSGSENELRERYAQLARQAIAAAVDPASGDYMNFDHGSQPVVDAAFLALALLRAPNTLWEKLSGGVKRQVVEAFRATRVIRPGFNNWLLFSATIEAFLGRTGEPWDPMRIDYAVREHEAWYKGDGIYGDGPQFHWDYYNSFVIQPMLLAVVETAPAFSKAWDAFLPNIVARAKRYASIEERLIAPDGSFPAIGRSLTYRFGAFQLLALMALRRQLPDGIAPGQARAALTEVLRRTMEAPGTFDSAGWLKVGLCGSQPGLAESYISTGSLYLCSAGFLPLGLKSADPFWSEPAKLWTSQKIWSGQDAPADHAI